jgi:hypothetical protein
MACSPRVGAPPAAGGAWSRTGLSVRPLALARPSTPMQPKPTPTVHPVDAVRLQCPSLHPVAVLHGPFLYAPLRIWKGPAHARAAPAAPWRVPATPCGLPVQRCPVASPERGSPRDLGLAAVLGDPRVDLLAQLLDRRLLLRVVTLQRNHGLDGGEHRGLRGEEAARVHVGRRGGA